MLHRKGKPALSWYASIADTDDALLTGCAKQPEAMPELRCDSDAKYRDDSVRTMDLQAVLLTRILHDG